jgi:hypothetical protein
MGEEYVEADDFLAGRKLIAMVEECVTFAESEYEKVLKKRQLLRPQGFTETETDYMKLCKDLTLIIRGYMNPA